MKITKQQLTKIIKEEVEKTLMERNFDGKTGLPVSKKGVEIKMKQGPNDAEDHKKLRQIVFDGTNKIEAKLGGELGSAVSNILHDVAVAYLKVDDGSGLEMIRDDVVNLLHALMPKQDPSVAQKAQGAPETAAPKQAASDDAMAGEEARQGADKEAAEAAAKAGSAQVQLDMLKKMLAKKERKGKGDRPYAQRLRAKIKAIEDELK